MIVGLVGCSKRKRSSPCLARDMYLGARFKKGRRFLEAIRCSDWAILSAKHGLLIPSTLIVPYEDVLTGTERIKQWTESTRRQIDERWPDPSFEFVVVAGEEYRGAVAHRHILDPLDLAHLGFGESLHILDEAVP